VLLKEEDDDDEDDDAEADDGEEKASRFNFDRDRDRSDVIADLFIIKEDRRGEEDEDVKRRSC
jgi:hypothetical protein